MSLSRHRDGRARTSKHTRRVRRANNDLRRQVRRMSIAGRSAFITLLAVLAQKSGEVVITQGTVDQVNENFARLSFEVQPKKDTNEFIVKLVEMEAPAQDTPEDTPGTADAEGTTDVEAVV